MRDDGRSRSVPLRVASRMTTFPPINNAFDALAAADHALEELDAQCCVPERSPRMAALAESLASIRKDLDDVDGEGFDVENLVLNLEDAGAGIGRLQIDCCAPGRMPLYAEMLTSLNKIQRSVRLFTGETMH